MNAMLRPMLEDNLPGWVEPRWFASRDELFALAPEAEIGWFDSFNFPATFEAARLGIKLKWLNTLGAGVESFPLAQLRAQGTTLTNGAGLNAIPIAEFAVMGMLTIAKGWRLFVRAQDPHEWLSDAPGTAQLFGSKALIVGAGGSGSEDSPYGCGEALQAEGGEIVL